MKARLSIYAILFGLIIFSFTRCKNKETPVVITSSISDITSSSAVSGGQILSDGGEIILTKGLCWKNSFERWRLPQEPTIVDEKVILGNGQEDFIGQLVNLEPGTTYFLRAFAITKNGIGYGPEVTFKTLSNLPSISSVKTSNITAYTAEIEGIVDPENIQTQVSCEFGTSTSYGQELKISDIIDGESTVKVEASVKGLLPKTTYHFRMKAENAFGVVYTKDQIFTTSELIFDIDGFGYEVITIGEQKWLKPNLRTTRYRDGTVIPLVSNDFIWSKTDSGAFCAYNKTNEAITSYGALYNWYAVKDPRGLCPAGWHVPTNEEWNTLTIHLGGPEIAGSKLKTTGTSSWSGSSIEEDNSSNFTAQGSGFRDQTGVFSGFLECTYFWSSTEYNHTHGISRKLYDDNPMISFSGNSKKSGFSVRCIKD